jgi:hypothetical protein
MKYLFLLLSITLFLFSSCSRDHKAKSLIKEYMHKNIIDFDSYKPVKYSILDTSWSVFSETERGKYLQDSLDKIEPKLIDTLFLDRIKAKSIKDLYYPLKTQYDKEDKLYNPVFNGWWVDHYYRVKNKVGLEELKDRTFFFDKDLTRIVRTWSSED